MAPSLKVLRDLRSGQSSPDAIASRLGLKTDEVEVILQCLKVDGLASSRPIPLWAIGDETSHPKSSGLHLWKLTDKATDQLAK